MIVARGLAAIVARAHSYKLIGAQGLLGAPKHSQLSSVPPLRST